MLKRAAGFVSNAVKSQQVPIEPVIKQPEDARKTSTTVAMGGDHTRSSIKSHKISSEHPGTIPVSVTTRKHTEVTKSTSVVKTLEDVRKANSIAGTATPHSQRSSSVIGLPPLYPLPTDEIHMKIMMVGDTAVGKTSIVRRIVEDAFTYQENATVGLDFKIRRMLVDSTQVRLQIWDTAGQERFQSITTQYFNRAHGFFLVYDITNERSFKNCDKWMQEIRLKGQNNVEIILLANKCDREEERKVSRDAGVEFAKKNGLVLWEISAQSNTQIERAFLELMRKIIDRRKHELEENARTMEFTNSYTLLPSATKQVATHKRCCSVVP